MDDKNFDKIDRSFMAALKGLREKPVDSYGLAGRVERRLRTDVFPSQARASRALPWLIPVLAFSLILTVPALYTGHGLAPATTRIQLASKPALSALDEELAILKEVGVWTEDDDRRVVPETEYEEVEFSRAVVSTRIV